MRTMPPKIDICIPTLLDDDQVVPQMAEIDRNTLTPHRIIASCQNVSAAMNRNFCLQWANSEIIISLDDDTERFEPGWETRLIRPLLEIPDAMIVSARLMTADNKPGPNCADNYDLGPEPWREANHLVEVFQRHDGYIGIPTACIAFRKTPVRFDERFQGSGWEDAQFNFYMKRLMPQGRCFINNACRLVHANHMVNQGGDNWKHNSELYWSLCKFPPEKTS